jgi:hypothetical protein
MNLGLPFLLVLSLNLAGQKPATPSVTSFQANHPDPLQSQIVAAVLKQHAQRHPECSNPLVIGSRRGSRVKSLYSLDGKKLCRETREETWVVESCGKKFGYRVQLITDPRDGFSIRIPERVGAKGEIENPQEEPAPTVAPQK